jgi:hypothetical protein
MASRDLVHSLEVFVGHLLPAVMEDIFALPDRTMD